MSSSVGDDLPAVRVLVVGLRADGTSEALASLASLDRAQPAPFAPRERRRFVPMPGMRINESGPTLGAPVLRELRTPQRRFALYECVDGPRSLLMLPTTQCERVLWVHSATRAVDTATIGPMLAIARFLGATRALCFVMDVDRASGSQRDAAERAMRASLSALGFDGDSAAVLSASGALSAVSDRWREGARALIGALDAEAVRVDEDPERFVFRVDEVTDERHYGPMLHGVVLSGSVSVGDVVDLLTSEGRRTLTVAELWSWSGAVERLDRGERGRVFIKRMAFRAASRGALLLAAGDGQIATRVRARAVSIAAEPRFSAGATFAIDPAGERVTVLASAADPSDPSAFDLELGFERPLPLARPVTLLRVRDEQSAFALAKVLDVLA